MHDIHSARDASLAEFERALRDELSAEEREAAARTLAAAAAVAAQAIRGGQLQVSVVRKLILRLATERNLSPRSVARVLDLLRARRSRRGSRS